MGGKVAVEEKVVAGVREVAGEKAKEEVKEEVKVKAEQVAKQVVKESWKVIYCEPQLLQCPTSQPVIKLCCIRAHQS